MGLSKLLDERSLIVCVGPGGVGKTTVSAAMALAAAKRGRKTAVITIDPARRLADALGLPDLSDALRPVDLASLTSGEPGDPADAIRGSLDAAMVDTAMSFDSLMRRIAPDEATLDRILGNRVFQAISRSLARSHAYVAMERLYEAVDAGGYDLIILDTPPARNALEILDAPGALARFFDAKVVGWFLPEQEQASQSFASRMFAGGGKIASRLLAMVTGQQLLDEILSFLQILGGLREGFAQRATRIEAMLREPSTAFCLVTSASSASADDAVWMREDLERRDVHIDAVVFNQSYIPLHPGDSRAIINEVPRCDTKTLVGKLRPHLPHEVPALEAWLESLREQRDAAARNNFSFQRIVDGVTAELPASCVHVRLPRFAREIHDMPALMTLVGELLASDHRRSGLGR